MGMAASQARLLGLQARQTNLEYQGQQINQERTILSQQCTALYNSLLAMQVPIPPSTQDYTTIEYSGSDGATNFTLGSVKPSGQNYLVELQTTGTGPAISANYGSSVCGKAGATVQGDNVPVSTSTSLGTYSPTTETPNPTLHKFVAKIGALGSDLPSGADPADYMQMDEDGNYVPVEEFESGTVYFEVVDQATYEADPDSYEVVAENFETTNSSFLLSEISDYYIRDGETLTQLTVDSEYIVKDGDSFTVNLPSGLELFHESPTGTESPTNPNAGATTIAGEVAYTFSEAQTQYPDLDWSKYEEAIRNTYGAQDSGITTDSFYVFFKTSDTGINEVYFALKQDVDSPDGFAQTLSYKPNGTFTKSEEKDQCKLEFDSSGRITKISIPEYDSGTGAVVSWRDIELKATKVTDNAAYQDAYNKYEYAQYEYDKTQQEINAKTEIIQQQDRNLELKLQRLDNERQQITTEIEAVEKVIQENIEDSYKTFSG